MVTSDLFLPQNFSFPYTISGFRPNNLFLNCFPPSSSHSLFQDSWRPHDVTQLRSACRSLSSTLSFQFPSLCFPNLPAFITPLSYIITSLLPLLPGFKVQWNLRFSFCSSVPNSRDTVYCFFFAEVSFSAASSLLFSHCFPFPTSLFVCQHICFPSFLSCPLNFLFFASHFRRQCSCKFSHFSYWRIGYF